jgi:hypothetical protein
MVSAGMAIVLLGFNVLGDAAAVYVSAANMCQKSWPKLPFDEMTLDAMRTRDQARLKLESRIFVSATRQQQEK